MSSAFQIGVVTTILALVAAVAIKEIPLRASHGPATDQSPAGAAIGEMAGEGLR